MNINIILNPVKVLELKEIKLHLEGTTPIVEAEIEQYRLLPANTQEQRLANGRLYIQKLITHCVKKVEGLQINGKDWDVQFKDNRSKEITDESYNILMRVFDVYVQSDVVGEIIDFYNLNRNQDESLFEINDEKKNS